MVFTALLPVQWGGTADPVWDHPSSCELCSVVCRGFCRDCSSGRGLVKAKPGGASGLCGANLLCSVQAPRCGRAWGVRQEPVECLCLRKSPESRAAREQQQCICWGCLRAPLTFSVAICLLAESSVLSSSWVPSRASPTSYDMHSHLIILKKKHTTLYPRALGACLFSAPCILFIEVLQHAELKQTACDQCLGGGWEIIATNLLWQKRSRLV